MKITELYFDGEDQPQGKALCDFVVAINDAKTETLCNIWSECAEVNENSGEEVKAIFGAFAQIIKCTLNKRAKGKGKGGTWQQS